MRYYLDSVIVIYAVEGSPAFRQRARSHLVALQLAGHDFIVSELTRTECLIPALGTGDGQRLLSFCEFFHSQSVRTTTFTAAMYERAAAAIRGSALRLNGPGSKPRRYSLTDALHLAAAVESGCDVFLTNDARLLGFPQLTVQELP